MSPQIGRIPSDSICGFVLFLSFQMHRFFELQRISIVLVGFSSRKVQTGKAPFLDSWFWRRENFLFKNLFFPLETKLGDSGQRPDNRRDGVPQMKGLMQFPFLSTDPISHFLWFFFLPSPFSFSWWLVFTLLHSVSFFYTTRECELETAIHR